MYRQRPKTRIVESTAAITLEDQGKLEEAVAAYRQAIDIKPDLAYSNLGNALEDQGKHDEAIAAYRHAIDIQPDCAEALSNLLFSLNYDDKSTAELQRLESFVSMAGELQRHESFVPWQVAAALQLDQKSATIWHRFWGDDARHDAAVFFCRANASSMRRG
jgi:tetratricopeptide (TPR) repeat protein